MAPTWRYIALAVVFLIPLVVALQSEDVATAPGAVQLICQVESVLVPVQANLVEVPVYITNITDLVAGYELLVKSSDPDFIRFEIDSIVDTTKYAHFDTTGARAGGWEFFVARVLDDSGGVLKIASKAEFDMLPPIQPPMPMGSGLLVKFYIKTNGTLGDSLCDSAVVRLILDRALTSFSNDTSGTIGCTYHLDTIYLPPCLEWDGDSCIGWTDTTFRWRCTMDTTKRVLVDGKVGFVCCKCGDANGDAAWDISDAVYLIQYIFVPGSPEPGPCGGTMTGLGDANGDTTVDISDAVYLIQYIFVPGSPEPLCP